LQAHIKTASAKVFKRTCKAPMRRNAKHSRTPIKINKEVSNFKIFQSFIRRIQGTNAILPLLNNSCLTKTAVLS
jgi:hypothetical protein